MWWRGTTEGQTGEEGHDHSCSVSAEDAHHCCSVSAQDPHHCCSVSAQDPHHCCSVSAQDPHHCCVAIIGHCHLHMSMLVALFETQEAKHSRPSCFVYWLNKHSENFATGHGIKAIPARSAPIMSKSLECTHLHMIGILTVKWAYTDGVVILPYTEVIVHAWDRQTERLYSLVMMLSQGAVALARCTTNMACWQVYVRPISDTAIDIV